MLSPLCHITRSYTSVPLMREKAHIPRPGSNEAFIRAKTPPIAVRSAARAIKLQVGGTELLRSGAGMDNAVSLLPPEALSVSGCCLQAQEVSSHRQRCSCVMALAANPVSHG
jgi:hypothetical protein